MVVEPDLFWEDIADPLATFLAVRKHFPRTESVTSDKFYRVAGGGKFRGSLALAMLRGEKFEYANAMKWLPYFRSEAVSKDGIFVDMAFAESLMHFNPKFVRPASPMKEFSGDIFNRHKLRKEIAFLTQNKNLHPHEIMCLVAAPVAIQTEWRCVFVNNKYVSGSQYMTNGQLDVNRIVPDTVREYAQFLAAKPYFINIFDFVLDIGKTQDGLRLVEINGFETASFYAADLDAIYSAWSETVSYESL